MQITMDGGADIRGYLATLEDFAVESRGVPVVLAREARNATLRNVRSAAGESGQEWRWRARRYFDATVRRMSARSCAPDVVRYRRRVIAESIASDLRQGGVSEERIRREVDEWLAHSA